MVDQAEVGPGMPAVMARCSVRSLGESVSETAAGVSWLALARLVLSV